MRFCSVPWTNYNFFTSAFICIWGTCINTNIFTPALLCVTASCYCWVFAALCTSLDFFLLYLYNRTKLESSSLLTVVRFNILWLWSSHAVFCINLTELLPHAKMQHHNMTIMSLHAKYFIEQFTWLHRCWFDLHSLSGFDCHMCIGSPLITLFHFGGSFTDAS